MVKISYYVQREDFSRWYNWAIEKAGLVDKRYPIKGTAVWCPYGFKIILCIDKLIRAEMHQHGFEEVEFPLLISEDQFSKEREHIKGFDEQVYWVTHAGERKLAKKLLLRPTSETAMYPIFALWVRSHADLPLKTYQIVKTFRYETKQTRSFIRVREIHFFEAHTCHRDFEDAEREVQEYFEMFEHIAEKLCMPYLLTKRPEWDKFPGAWYTVSIDVLMPNGRTLQVGSMHQYRQNFSKPYDIKYEDELGKQKYVYQTTFGMSERLLGAIIGVHGDEKGLILPPAIAPIQIVIIPIYKKGKKKEVVEECKDIQTMLKGFRVHLDDREELTPGSKYYRWERKGVPLRIEIGARDLKKGVVTLVRRDTSQREKVKREEIATGCGKLLKAVKENLYAKAKSSLVDGIEVFDELKRAKNITALGWCGSTRCGRQMEDELDLNTLGHRVGEKRKTACVVCGKGTNKLVYLAKAY